MRILLYARVRLFGESLGACLEDEDAVTAVAVEHQSLDLGRRATAFEADIILFDVTPRSELATVRAVTDECPGTPIVALAVPQFADDVIACADAGFVSYVPRDSSLADLMLILRMALRGEAQCDPRIARSLLEEIRRRRDPDVFRDPDAQLTRREVETLRLVSLGLTNKEIAAQLNLSVATVKNHVHAVLRKLELKRRTEARQLLSEKPWLLRSG
jgi:DNA-binding NarL/FixJ family response regulator